MFAIPRTDRFDDAASFAPLMAKLHSAQWYLKKAAKIRALSYETPEPQRSSLLAMAEYVEHLASTLRNLNKLGKRRAPSRKPRPKRLRTRKTG